MTTDHRCRVQIVAGHDRYFHFVGDVQILRERFDRGTAAERVDPARVGDDFDAALHARRQDIAKMRHKIGRIAGSGIAGSLFLQDGHGDFGEIVHHQVVDRTTLHLPARRGGIVSPEPAAIGDDRPLHLNSSRAITIRCTSDVPSPISHNFASR